MTLFLTHQAIANLIAVPCLAAGVGLFTLILLWAARTTEG